MVYFPNLLSDIFHSYLQVSKADAQPEIKKKAKAFGLSYLIDENPPWYVCFLLGFQVMAIDVVIFILFSSLHCFFSFA